MTDYPELYDPEVCAMTDEPTNNPCQLADELPPLQGGMTNDELRAAWKRKLPTTEPTDNQLSCFAIGVEVGYAIVTAAAVARERARCLNEIECGIWIDKTTEEVLDSIAAAIRKGG